MDKAELKSRYERLEIPNFHSTIPTHLLGQLSDQEKYLVETLSKIDQQNQWLITAAIEANRADVETDLRVQELEKWKDMLTSKWAVVSGFLILCIPVVLKALLEYVLHR